MTRCYSVKDNGGEDDDDSRVDELVPGFDQSLCKQIFQDIIKTCIRIFAWMVEESFTPGPDRVRDLQSPEIFRLFRHIHGIS